jgi:hypothetical protein
MANRMPDSWGGPGLIRILNRLGYTVVDGLFTLGLCAAYCWDYCMSIGGMQAMGRSLLNPTSDQRWRCGL